MLEILWRGNRTSKDIFFLAPTNPKKKNIKNPEFSENSAVSQFPQRL